LGLTKKHSYTAELLRRHRQQRDRCRLCVLSSRAIPIPRWSILLFKLGLLKRDLGYAVAEDPIIGPEVVLSFADSLRVIGPKAEDNVLRMIDRGRPGHVARLPALPNRRAKQLQQYEPLFDTTAATSPRRFFTLPALSPPRMRRAAPCERKEGQVGHRYNKPRLLPGTPVTVETLINGAGHEPDQEPPRVASPNGEPPVQGHHIDGTAIAPRTPRVPDRGDGARATVVDIEGRHADPPEMAFSRSVRRAMHPVRTVKRAATPERDQNVEARSGPIKQRGLRSQQAESEASMTDERPSVSQGTCPLKHRSHAPAVNFEIGSANGDSKL